MAGITSATTPRTIMLLPLSAASLLKRSSLCLQPPSSIASPSTIRMLPMIEPVSEALTISVSPARRAMKAMISSAALPNVALSSPPTPGPVWCVRCSVASPISPARGRIARQEVTKTSVGEAWDRPRPMLTGRNTSRARIRFFAFSMSVEPRSGEVSAPRAARPARRTGPAAGPAARRGRARRWRGRPPRWARPAASALSAG